MHPAHGILLRGLHSALWLAWAAYWFVSARNVKKTVRREPWSKRVGYAVPLVLVAPLYLWPGFAWVLLHRFSHHPLAMYWTGTALLAAGLLFSVWARRTLGRNWSGTVTVKQDHELIQTGPYRWVRHPIYTGLLIAVAGSGLSWNRWMGLYVLAVAFVALWIKLLHEERFMRETFGEKYEAYCARTKRLVPGVL